MAAPPPRKLHPYIGHLLSLQDEVVDPVEGSMISVPAHLFLVQTMFPQSQEISIEGDVIPSHAWEIDSEEVLYRSVLVIKV